jgi:hypothetical protein
MIASLFDNSNMLWGFFKSTKSVNPPLSAMVRVVAAVGVRFMGVSVYELRKSINPICPKSSLALTARGGGGAGLSRAPFTKDGTRALVDDMAVSGCTIPTESIDFSLSSFESRIILGSMRETRGFRLGTQAQIIPTLTSTADHMNDNEAYPDDVNLNLQERKRCLTRKVRGLRLSLTLRILQASERSVLKVRNTTRN